METGSRGYGSNPPCFSFFFLFCLFVVVVVAFFPFDLRVDMAAEMLEQWGHVREVCGSIPR